MSRRTISWQLRAAMAAQKRGAVFMTREAPELVLYDRTSGLKATPRAATRRCPLRIVLANPAPADSK
jgi:hypothetical protein